MSKESNPFVRLAEEAVKKYIIEHKIMRPPEDLPSEMKERGGVFVSLKKNKRLRGCIGTFIPTRDSIAEEIIQNAISSATKDPRFPPVTIKEIEELEYSVDLLSPPEPVSDVKDLDPKRYGVIVKNGDKRGLLLPDLDGVDTVSKQIEIAKQKADISKDEEIELFRFEVKRYR
ncbi:MAG: AmmeMemoRadiSam system protein A [Nitrospirota bacterium]